MSEMKMRFKINGVEHEHMIDEELYAHMKFFIQAEQRATIRAWAEAQKEEWETNGSAAALLADLVAFLDEQEGHHEKSD